MSTKELVARKAEYRAFPKTAIGIDLGHRWGHYCIVDRRRASENDSQRSYGPFSAVTSRADRDGNRYAFARHVTSITDGGETST
jgi:hypothetical protein